MKALRYLGLVVLVLGGLFILRLGWQHHRASKEAQEVLHMSAVQSNVVERLDAYFQAHGKYPESLELLPFENTAFEQQLRTDARKLRYMRIVRGYVLSYPSRSGEHFQSAVTRPE